MQENGISIELFPLKNINNISNNFNIEIFYKNILLLDTEDITSLNNLKNSCLTLEDITNDLRVKEVKKRSLITCPFTISKNHHLGVSLYCIYRRAIKGTVMS